MGIMDAARARASAWATQLKLNELPAWWRRQDRSAERAAIATRASPFLGKLYTWLAFTAWFLEFGFATLWALRANGEIDWTYRIALGDGQAWTFNFAAHVLPASLTTLAVGAIVAISVTWIPVYNALRGMGRLRRGSVLVVGPLCTAIAILGAIVVQVENVSMDARDAEVVQQQAGQDRAALERQQDRLQQQLDNMRNRNVTNEYAALAATVGEDAYRRLYISEAALAREPSAARRELLVRAVGAATEADAIEARIEALDGQIAAAPVAAELAATTSEVRSQDVLGLVQWANDHRVVLIGVTLSIIGLLCLWQAQGLKEAAALLNPDAPVEEAKAAASDDPGATAGQADAPVADPPPPQELVLPPLPDLRGVADPEFDAVQTPVDEFGRKLKRVAGSFRPEREAPRSQADQRRPPADDPLASFTPVDAPAAAPDEPPAESFGDIAEDIARRAQEQHAAQQAASEAAA